MEFACFLGESGRVFLVLASLSESGSAASTLISGLLYCSHATLFPPVFWCVWEQPSDNCFCCLSHGLKENHWQRRWHPRITELCLKADNDEEHNPRTGSLSARKSRQKDSQLSIRPLPFTRSVHQPGPVRWVHAEEISVIPDLPSPGRGASCGQLT